VVDETGTEVSTAQVGELIVKGPGVMKGYLNHPQATAETVVDGWLHTGDIARKDEDGYIYIVDRKKDMIIRGGYNVYPREVEEVLFQHPDVVEAGVFGVPHVDLGEEVAAEVVLRPGSATTESDIRQFVKDRIAAFKYPRIVRFVEDLPKSHTGKVLKRDLRRKWKDNPNP
jgi:long-chain acyl-CoA synthetase